MTTRTIAMLDRLIRVHNLHSLANSATLAGYPEEAERWSKKAKPYIKTLARNVAALTDDEINLIKRKYPKDLDEQLRALGIEPRWEMRPMPCGEADRCRCPLPRREQRRYCCGREEMVLIPEEAGV